MAAKKRRSLTNIVCFYVETSLAQTRGFGYLHPFNLYFGDFRVKKGVLASQDKSAKLIQRRDNFASVVEGGGRDYLLVGKTKISRLS